MSVGTACASDLAGQYLPDLAFHTKIFSGFEDWIVFPVCGLEKDLFADDPNSLDQTFLIVHADIHPTVSDL